MYHGDFMELEHNGDDDNHDEDNDEGKRAKERQHSAHPRDRWVEPEAVDLVGGLELQHGMDEIRKVPQQHVRIIHLR